MPIPVVIPGTPLPITDQVTARAEKLLENFIRAVNFGTTGASLNTPAVTIDDGNGGTKPVIISTAQQQLFYREQMIALAASLESRAKGEVVGTTAGPTTGSGSFVVIPQMTQSLTTTGGALLVTFSSSFLLNISDSFDFSIFVDGSQVVNSQRHMESAVALASVVGSTQALITNLSAATHTIDVRWKVTAGAATAVGILRSLTAVEL